MPHGEICSQCGVTCWAGYWHACRPAAPPEAEALARAMEDTRERWGGVGPEAWGALRAFRARYPRQP